MMSSRKYEHPGGKAEKSPRKAVLCAKCEHLNADGGSTCTKCGAHLYVSCVDCGERNERVKSRCSNCGRKLHRNLLERYKRRVFGRGPKFNPTAILLFLVGVALVFGIIVLISNITLPTIW